MIYSDLNLAKDDLNWLLSSNTILSDSTTTLNSKKIQMIVENLTSYENKYLEMFYSELLNNLDFENLNFSKKISKQFLPTLAFVPEIGMVLVYEYSKDGSFKAQYKDGIKVFDSFPKDTK